MKGSTAATANSRKIRHFMNFMQYLFLFFFSSRRRHTRSLRDWSSDGCSSDLGGSGGEWGVLSASAGRQSSFPGSGPPGGSEERRVGKGCTSRSSPQPHKTN